MRILLSGASSFTGYWFIKALAEADITVTACFRGCEANYDGVRGRRVTAIAKVCEPVWGVEVGDDRFMTALRSGNYDVFCHHAAEMTDYRSWNFDPIKATSINTRSARQIVEALRDKGGQRIVMTGSVFEPFEGYGDAAQRAFSPYGLSKHLSFEVYRMEAERVGLSLDKFVIPNPFGALEEPKFTSYLIREWAGGRTPSCNTPAYIRDNIPVNLLALAYRDFVALPYSSSGNMRACPSGYVESQGMFAERIARQMSARQGRTLTVDLTNQTEFLEPLVRINQQPPLLQRSDWNEDAFWNDAFDFWDEACI